jgi:multidrug efflux pump subunit AcrA (membrane-fusion protein)/YHS domain-containing protein
MKKVTYLALAAAFAAAAFAAGAWNARRTAGAPGERKILHWVDPMHPSYTSDRPGMAPDCGMPLEPVYADGGPASPAGASQPGTVSVSADRQQLFGVRLGAVERGSPRHAIRLFGRVAPDETRVYSVNAALDGSIHDVSAVTTGSQVRKSQRLGSFFSIETRQPILAFISALDVAARAARIASDGADVPTGAKAEWDAFPIQLRNADQNTLLQMERLKGIGMAQAQIDEIVRTRKAPLTVDILSPADGFVLARNATPGQKFEKGAEWYRIADLRRVWIVADLFEADAKHLRPGMHADVSLPNQGKKLAATVSDVLPQFDPTTRTLKVRLEADNPGFALRPEMFVDVEVQVRLPEAITVPADAVMDAGLRKTVFVDRGGGAFEARPVETGWRAGGRVEVVRGLEPGERIVVSGTFLVDSESRLRAAAVGVRGDASKDPVCGMDVDEAKARAAGKHSEHGGRHWFFCSETCKHEFDAAPVRFGAGAREGEKRLEL